MRVSLRLCARRTADFIGVSVSEVAKNSEHSGKNAYTTVQNVLSVKKNLTVPEWNKLKYVFSGPGFAYQAVSVIMKDKCGLEEARKLTSALEMSDSLNLITKAQMLRAYGFFSSECTMEDHKFIEETIDEVLSTYPVLSADLSSYLLSGLMSTPLWKERADLILKKSAEVNHTVLCIYAQLAFEHKEFDLGWDTMEKAVSTGPNFVPSLYNCIVDHHESHPQENLIFKLLDFLEKHSKMMTSYAAESLSNILNRSDNLVARFSSVDLRGHCTCCKRRLQRLPLTAEEHKTLLSGLEEQFDLKCRFNTYQQEEVDQFKEFLESCPPYTLVVDGLNLFYRSQKSELLTNSISKLRREGHKMLVICRDHLRGHKEFCNLFKSHTLYFLNNRTKDDTFVIYAALFKERGAFVLSNDFYGTYYTSLKGASKILFRKWQLSHHVVCSGYLAMDFLLPTHTPIAQRTSNGLSIHVPLVTDDLYSAFAPYAWLCIQKVSVEEKQKSWRLWPHKPFVHEIESKSGATVFRQHAHNVRKQHVNSKKLKKSYAVYY
ncbi:Mitochondrial ribonuclease P catalytic subunit [Frankliniella fusca]|uniref:Mitochondrial ribonuclease P catalytic subunit n=1 Tax=Frankliniella fusca TaxID=407009 RepID=A0AAE1HRG4_9NEOP|nr:Mitochondrial ribonuclease P catalytic subunit [Frankliniella fusca]